MSLLLPPPRRHDAPVLTFWFLLCGCLALGVWIVGILSGSSWSMGVGAVVGVAAAVTGVLLRRLASFTYRAWNRAVRLYCISATGLVKRVCFHALLPMGRHAQRDLILSRPREPESLWTPKARGANRDGVWQGSVPTSNEWIRDVVAWSRGSGGTWVLALLPFLVLIRFFDPGLRTQPPPPDIYTLY